MCPHILNTGEQMVRCDGYYRNVSRGKRQKEGSDDTVPFMLEPQGLNIPSHNASRIYHEQGRTVKLTDQKRFEMTVIGRQFNRRPFSAVDIRHASGKFRIDAQKFLDFKGEFCRMGRFQGYAQG